MFWLITGKPGSGKTAHALDFVLHDKRFLTPEGSPRPVYYRGIPDVTVPWHELTEDEVQNWHEHLPVGAVLVVDEAQEIWRVRAPSKPVPPGLVALEKHRHKGWDVIFISQDPSLLDQHARKLCNEQFHYSRPFGAKVVNEYHSGTGYFDPSSTAGLASAIKRKKGLPKRVFGLYKSAELHTHKFKVPRVVYAIVLLLALAALLVWRVSARFMPTEDLQVMQVEQVSRPGVVQPELPWSWSALLEPEVRSLPFTAPLYGQLARTPRSVPVVHGCMSMRADFSDCQCHTQQGTRIRGIAPDLCRTIIRDGLFNHLEPDEQGKGGRQRFPDEERTNLQAAL